MAERTRVEHFETALERIVATWERGPHPRGPQMLVAIAKDALRLAPPESAQVDELVRAARELARLSPARHNSHAVQRLRRALKSFPDPEPEGEAG